MIYSAGAPSSAFSDQDRDFMQTALDLARQGQGFVSPNPMVGAVVVQQNRVVGRGYHQAAGQAHAEVNALADAGKQARGADLYVTLEPCNHQGRTPPCTRAIIEAGIRGVICAMPDPNPSVAGGGLNFLKNNGVETRCGLLEDQARHLNEVFIKYITTRRPFVVLKCAATLDGRIATRTGDSRWVTGPESRSYVHELRHSLDAILVGIETVIRDDPSLTARLEDRKTRDPVRIILDSHLRIPETAKVLHAKSGARTLIVTDKDRFPALRRQELESKGVQVFPASTNEGRIDLNALMTGLGAMEITSLLVEGGARVLASALKAGIVDKVMLFYAPKLMGGDDAVPMFSGPGPESMSGCLEIGQVKLHRFSDDIMIEGYV